MKFCDVCQAIMKPALGALHVQYNCDRCMNSAAGSAEDTLLAEGYKDSHELQREKHQAFIEESAFDAAGNKVSRECPQCKMPYMTLVLIGENLTKMYTCTCGYRAE